MGKVKNRYVISVLVADRVGILRDITSAVADMGANIDGISQTVVAGYFTVILTASFNKLRKPEEIRSAILHNFGGAEVEVQVRPYDVNAVRRVPAKGSRYVLTITGKDRKGILKAVTAFLSDRNINVEDWYVEFDGENVMHIGEVSVPKLLDIRQVQDELRQLLSKMGLESYIQHENIFKATNEVGAIGSLLKGGK